MNDKRTFWIALLTSIIVLAVFQIGKFAFCCTFGCRPVTISREMTPPRHGRMGMCPQMQGCPMMNASAAGPMQMGQHRGRGPRFFVMCPQCGNAIKAGMDTAPRMNRNMFRHGRRGGEARNFEGRKALRDRKPMNERKGYKGFMGNGPENRKDFGPRGTRGRRDFGAKGAAFKDGKMLPPPAPKADGKAPVPAPKAEVKTPAADAKANVKAPEVKPAQ